MNLVARYFLFVGGALLALLVAFDALAPKASANNTTDTTQSTAGVDKSTLRIQSNQKWPEKIVFDTTQPTIVPKAAPAPQVAIADPEPAPEISAKARVRETFAQFVPVEPKQAETPAPRKRKVAKVRHSQPMRFAQQQRYGFFGPNTW
jgi:hypothetical protein